jgi:hypothetical protein
MVVSVQSFRRFSIKLIRLQKYTIHLFRIKSQCDARNTMKALKSQLYVFLSHYYRLSQLIIID